MDTTEMMKLWKLRHRGRQRGARCESEMQEQIRFARWLTRNKIRFTASANGGKRDYLTAAKLKQSGVSAGFPDITLPYPYNGFHGLFIELKREYGGKVSDLQQEWLDYLNSVGYCAKVARGFKEATDIVREYFGDKVLYKEC